MDELQRLKWEIEEAGRFRVDFSEF